jgi:hypothetical protein
MQLATGGPMQLADDIQWSLKNELQEAVAL